MSASKFHAPDNRRQTTNLLSVVCCLDRRFSINILSYLYMNRHGKEQVVSATKFHAPDNRRPTTDNRP